MGNVNMEATQINYRGGSKKMSVEEAIKAAGTEITPEEKTWIDSIPTLDNEVNGDATVYPYADVITIEDAVPANLADCNVKIEPVQDLHGQSAPYVGGASRNKLPLTVEGIKAANTSGTWSGNDYTINGVTFTILTDSDGNISGIKMNGTASPSYAHLVIPSDELTSKYIGESCIVNITGAEAGQTDYRIWIGSTGYGDIVATNGSDATFTVTNDLSKIWLQVLGARSVSNVIVHPMIRLSTETDSTFAPYTNICPITGHTEASVTDEGTQLVPNGTDTSNGYKDNYYLTSNGVENTGGDTYISEYFDVVANVSYILKDRMKNANAASVCFYNANKQYISGYAVNKETKIITTPSNAVYARCTQIKNLIENEIYFKRANQYTIALGDTIYGGTVDFDSGVMTVTHKMVDMGDLSWEYYAVTQGNLFRTYLSDIKQTPASGLASCISSDYRVVLQTLRTNGTISSAIGSNQIDVVDNRYNDATAFKTAMDGVQLCYELATPTTIQLTPQQIQLLKGQNTLTASTGQISVTVNGVSGAIGAVQTQANNTDEALAELAEQLPDAPTTDGTYVLTVTVADGAATYSWESAT